MSRRVMTEEICDALVRARIVTANEVPEIRRLSVVMEPRQPVRIHVEKLVDGDMAQVIRELGRVEPIEAEG